MQTDSSAIATCLRLRSTVECTATVRMPSAWQARRMRSAISPRLAMTTLSSRGLGIRDWGFGKRVVRLTQASFVCADQRIEARERAVEEIRIDSGAFVETKAAGNFKLSRQF